MKKITFLLSLLISAVSFGQATDLYFSMYAEGSANNKWLEIYNGTGEDYDISNYKVVIFSNGDPETEPGNTYVFPEGTIIVDGDVFVIGNAEADAQIQDESDITSDVTWYNGDDAVVLYDAADNIIDLIGEIGSDPGSYWAVGDVADGTKEHTLIRKASVCSPNSTPLGSFGTDAASSEWEVYDQDTQWEAIGAHTGCDDMAVGDVLLSEFVMYPNPSRDGKVTIQTVEGSEISVTVFDILGKKVISKSLSNNELNISGLKTGIYLVQVSQNGATVTKKLIVE